MNKRRFFLLFALLALLTLAPLALTQAQGFGVTVTPDRDEVFVRIGPAIGQEVIGALLRGQVLDATGLSANREWLRVNFYGAEGWIHRDVLVIQGNPNTLPGADPYTWPLDFGDGPRAGISGAVGPATIRLPESGIRFRAGPSRAYFTLGNVPRYEVVAVTGRSPDDQWLQVNYRGQLGWIANLGDTFIQWEGGSIDLLPVWGIIADAPPRQPAGTGPSATRDAIMTAMLLHIDISLNQLAITEGVWNTIAQGGGSLCITFASPPQPFIPRQEDLNAYPELDAVIAALNEGLEETGRAIDLWEEWCGFWQAGEYASAAALIDDGLAASLNARQGYERARQLIWGLGLVPTPTPPPPGFTPAPAVPTATEPPGNLPDTNAFILEGSRVTFTTQFTHPELGCNWQGLGGQVIGLNGEPVLGLVVRIQGITDPTLILSTVSGANTNYGPAGWELQTAGGPNTHVFEVALFQEDRQVSEAYQIGFPGDCNRTLGIVNFVQVLPLE